MHHQDGHINYVKATKKVTLIFGGVDIFANTHTHTHTHR